MIENNNVIHVLVGVAGVGKSTYIKNHLVDTRVFSSDQYRIDLYGTRTEGNKHNGEVFNKLHEDLRHYLKDNDNVTAVYDATNINHARRRGFYDQFHKLADIRIIFFYEPLSVILEQNAQRSGDAVVPESAVRRMYKSLQPPRIGRDCDAYMVVSRHRVFNTNNLDGVKTVNDLVALANDAIVEEIKANITPHNSPYHRESVDEHIALTIKNAEDDNFLQEVARYHDLGKGLAKQFVTETRAMYRGHENLGAIYALVNRSTKDWQSTNDPLVAVVYHHMQALYHQLEKATKKDQLTPYELSNLEKFAEIDRKSSLEDH